jgi:hypothetical protein
MLRFPILFEIITPETPEVLRIFPPLDKAASFYIMGALRRSGLFLIAG